MTPLQFAGGSTGGTAMCPGFHPQHQKQKQKQQNPHKPVEITKKKKKVWDTVKRSLRK
jgi:hypothetical protein